VFNPKLILTIALVSLATQVALERYRAKQG
jgi:hypothetical protein